MVLRGGDNVIYTVECIQFREREALMMLKLNLSPEDVG